MNAQRIAIITDSGTCVAPQFIKDHDIFVVPLRVCYSDGSTYESGVNITPNEILARFEQEIPTTSLPSPQAIQHALEQARDKGYERAVIVTIASKLSATYETMRLVAEQMPDFPTVVIDSRSIGMVAGMVCERATEFIERGGAFEEVEAYTERYADYSRVYFCAKTLDYVYKGGRINGAIYRISKVLNIKPILTCGSDGAYTLAKKARGWEKALDMMGSIIEDHANEWGACRISICTSSINEELDPFYERRFKLSIPQAIEVTHADISAELLVHTGPDLIGLGIQKVL